MFLFLGLVLLPFASAVVHDVTVGAAGKLHYDPEAIVRNRTVNQYLITFLSSVLLVCKSW